MPVTVHAADFSAYGQVRFGTWYMNGRGWNAFYPDNYDPAPNLNPGKVGRSDNETVWEVMTSSRLGFNFSHGDNIKA